MYTALHCLSMPCLLVQRMDTRIYARWPSIATEDCRECRVESRGVEIEIGGGEEQLVSSKLDIHVVPLETYRTTARPCRLFGGVSGFSGMGIVEWWNSGMVERWNGGSNGCMCYFFGACWQ